VLDELLNDSAKDPAKWPEITSAIHTVKAFFQSRDNSPKQSDTYARELVLRLKNAVDSDE